MGFLSPTDCHIAKQTLTGAVFLGDDLRQGEAGDLGRRKWPQFEVGGSIPSALTDLEIPGQLAPVAVLVDGGPFSCQQEISPVRLAKLRLPLSDLDDLAARGEFLRLFRITKQTLHPLGQSVPTWFWDGRQQTRYHRHVQLPRAGWFRPRTL